ELDMEILGVDENNRTTKESVEVNVTMKDNFANLALYVWDSEEFRESYPTSDRRFREPAEYTTTITLDLAMGENEIPVQLVDEAGNETVRTIAITREPQEPVVTGDVHFSLFKDTTSSANRVDFDNISNFYIKNKETGEVFSEGYQPIWNTPHAF